MLFRVWSDKMLQGLDKGRERRSVEGEMCECGWWSAGHAGEGVLERSLAVMWVRLLEWIAGEDCFKLSGQNEGKHQSGKLNAVGDWWTDENMWLLFVPLPLTEWAGCLLGFIRLSCWCDIHFYKGFLGARGKLALWKDYLSSPGDVWHITNVLK